MIKNMGLHWLREYVWWGSPGGKGVNAGHLKGKIRIRYTDSVKSNKDKEYRKNWPTGEVYRIVDFRSQKGVYVLYQDFDIVYIGQAGSGRGGRSIFDRLKSHTSDTNLRSRWNKFSWFGVCDVILNDKLNQHDGYQLLHQNEHFKVSGYQPTQRLELDILLNHLEGIMVEASEGLMNKQGAKWTNAKRIEQYIDEGRFSETIDNKIREISGDLKRIEQLIRQSSVRK